MTTYHDIRGLEISAADPAAVGVLDQAISGFLGAVRASPIYFRVHVFGDEGSVEALGETQTVIRLKGGKTEVKDFPKIDSVLAEMDAFADAVAGVAPYPISTDEMVNTIASFEGVIKSITTEKSVRV